MIPGRHLFTALCGLWLTLGAPSLTRGQVAPPPRRVTTSSSSLAGPSLMRGQVAPLRLEEVLAGVTNQYPPLLAALIERDVASGRLQSSRAPFDFNVFAKIFSNPTGFYDSSTVDAGFEQFTGWWGSTIFGGYRLTRGGTLPDYDKDRTQSAGEPRIGFRLPLLRDGAIDRRRAAVLKARLDQELADPFIQRQHLDFIRAASVGYYAWLAAGQRLRLAEDLQRIANDRGAALTNQVNSGLIARIALKDNERLIVSRGLAVVQARRRFEAAAIALSLFHRDTGDSPLVAGRERLPAEFPAAPPPNLAELANDIELAISARPEPRRLKLAMDKLAVDLRLAKNQLLPQLDAGVTISQDFGRKLYKDKSDVDTQLGLEFRLPLQRSEAKGRVNELNGQLEQLTKEERFARDRIAAEVRDAASALGAAHEQIQQARLNASLAAELQAAEAERLRRGATDLLALQLREQAAFDARVLEVDALAEYFRALADFRAAIARDGRRPANPRP